MFLNIESNFWSLFGSTAWQNCTQAEIPVAATGPNYAAFASDDQVQVA